MNIDPKRFSVFIVNSGFRYSSEDVSNSIYRAFERTCGKENVFQYQTQSGYDFCKKILTTYNVFNDKDSPVHYDIVQLLSDPILRYVIQVQPDLVLFIHGGNINMEVVECLKTSCPNTRTAIWLVDDPMQVDHSETYSNKFDYVFVNEKNTVRIHGEDKSWHLPLAFNDELFDVNIYDLEDRFKSEILIFGSLYPERVDFIEELYEYISKYDLLVAGKIIERGREFKRESLKTKYREGILDQRELAHYIAGSKICLDIPRRQDFSEYGRTNTRNIEASYLNPRIYETAAVDSLILTSSSRVEIKDTFEKDEFILYDDVEDCANKIIYYLENEKERKAITDKARKRVWKEHRYIDRANKIIECLPEKALNTRIHGLNLSREEQNEFAIHKNKETWQKNLNDNVEFCNFGTLNQFNGSGEERTALIVSNGPSLEDELATLSIMMQKDVVDPIKNLDIFTMNSAYKVLRERNIIPKFQVQIHPTDDQTKHFESVDQDETIFLASILLNNKVIHAWKGEKRLFMPKGTLKMGLTIPPEYENKLALVESALVVAFTATAIACHFGYKRVGFLGLDFSFVNNRKYAFEKCNFDEEIRNGYIVQKDINGSPVITSYVNLDACNFMIALTHGQADVEFYNFTGQGLLYGNRIKQMDLMDFLIKTNRRDN